MQTDHNSTVKSGWYSDLILFFRPCGFVLVSLNSQLDTTWTCLAEGNWEIIWIREVCLMGVSWHRADWIANWSRKTQASWAAPFPRRWVLHRIGEDEASREQARKHSWLWMFWVPALMIQSDGHEVVSQINCLLYGLFVSECLSEVWNWDYCGCPGICMADTLERTYPHLPHPVTRDNQDGIFYTGPPLALGMYGTHQ